MAGTTTVSKRDKAKAAAKRRARAAKAALPKPKLVRSMRVRGKRRYDGSVAVRASRYQGQGGRPAGVSNRERPAGLWTEYERKKLFGKFQDLDIDLRLLVSGRMELHVVTLNNPNVDPEDWLRASEMAEKLRRTLQEHVYKDQPIVVMAWWVEEFGRDNKPHMHMQIMVPSPRFAKPKWRGRTYKTVGEMLTAIGKSIFKRQNPTASNRELAFVAKTRRVVEKKIGGYARRIREMNAYMSKSGENHDPKQQHQDLGADVVHTNDKNHSGYFGLVRVPDSDILVVDEDGEAGVLALISEVGWSLSEGDAKPRKGGVVMGDEDKILSAGAVLGRRAWRKLMDTLRGAGQKIKNVFQ